jgi:5-methylcytosine-specific restriction endonuclease McrA
VPFPKVTPLAPERFALQVTISKSTHDKLRHAQELLSHALPSGDLAQVLDRALDALIGQLEKSKFAATDRPRTGRQGKSTKKRCIPARVKRAVWERDQGQCTFVGDTGHRCASRKFLEYDHLDPIARGGTATVESIRLRCRSHNQYEAERTLGDGFMHEKRERARRARATEPWSSGRWARN